MTVVLLDCDGPLADFGGAYLRALEHETGARHTVDEIDRWQIANCDFFKRLTADHLNLKRRCDEHVARPGFCDAIEVQPGAVDAVARLSEIAEVYVVTSPWDSSPTWMYERLHWIARHFPSIGRRHVIQTARKHLICGDVFVDDKFSHVDDWLAMWPAGTAILFDMHHNRGESVEIRGGWEHVIAAAESAANR